MTEKSSRNFRIYLDLHSFFDDHRRAAVIFVTKNIKTILDLQNRIALIFQIEGFYLCVTDRFLPPSEDVRVLETDQIVRVMRDHTKTEATPKKKKHKEKNNVLYETLFPKKHPLSPKNSQEEMEVPKKRTKKIPQNCDSTVDKGSIGEAVSKKPPKQIVQEVSLPKKEETSPKREHLKINTLLPVLQTHINGCNNIGRSKTYDFVRLSHLADTPICPSPSQPVPTITDKYLEKKTVNIVKIDIIKKGNVSLSVNETQLAESPEVNGFQTPPNYVKTAVKRIEERESPKESVENCRGSVKNEDSFVKRASDQETVVIDPEVDDLSIAHSISEDGVKKVEETIVIDKELPPVEYSTPEDGVKKETQSVTSAVSPSNFFYTQRTLSGLGTLLGNLVESDSLVSADSNTDDRFVTKRVRKRVRRHKNKKNSLEVTELNPPVPEPLKTQARPKIHIKFSEEGDSQPGRESVVLVSDEEPGVALKGDEFLFQDENIQRAPLMTNMQPKMGDIVAFKILRLSESYTPQISEHIVGRIEALQDERARFRILRGAEQCSLPVGKLSLLSDEDPQLKSADVQELDWGQIIEPRLLFP
ncbi:coilin-like [Cylas formicarius]|uniref:coilin-like n=1 Tax=Cylas formicarius TaxID=197179 RepID=UPI002958B722|nr:coilin-like [Cylas formicarius]